MLCCFATGRLSPVALFLPDPPTAFCDRSVFQGYCPEDFGQLITQLAASVGAGVRTQLPGPDVHRLEHRAFSRRG